MHLVTVRKWIGIELIEVSFVEKLVSILGGGLPILLLIGLSHWAIPNAIHQLGFRVVLIPALTNALVMVVLALILNSAFK